MTILQQVYAFDREKTRPWPVPADTQPGTAVVSPAGNEPGVAITARGDSTISKTNPDGTVTSGIANGGVAHAADEATVATDGSWRGPVTGASATTPRGTLVYAVVAGGAVTSLTLTVGSNVKFGVVDSKLGNASATDTAIKIGVFA